MLNFIQNETFLALLGGVMVGVLFRLIKLPIPAPPVISGLLGVVGVYLGAKIVDFFSSI